MLCRSETDLRGGISARNLKRGRDFSKAAGSGRPAETGNTDDNDTRRLRIAVREIAQSGRAAPRTRKAVVRAKGCFGIRFASRELGTREI